MLGEMLKIRAGIDLLHFPYKGAQGVQDTIAGAPAHHQGIPRSPRSSSAGSFARWHELAAPPAGAAGRADFFRDLAGIRIQRLVRGGRTDGNVAPSIQRMNLEFNRILLDGEIEPKLRALGIYTEGTGPPEEIGRS